MRIKIARPIAEPVWRSRSDSIELNQARFDAPTEPVTIASLDGAWSIGAVHNALPFDDGAVQFVDVDGVVELVRDDRAFFAELVRIVAPGGSVRLRVPASGLLAGFDGLNLYRYVADVARRGVRIPDVDETGFRRHYSARDLAECLGSRFQIVRRSTSGTGLSELAHFGALSALTLAQRSADAYLPRRACFERLIARDRAVPLPKIGFWLTVEARRLAD